MREREFLSLILSEHAAGNLSPLPCPAGIKREDGPIGYSFTYWPQDTAELLLQCRLGPTVAAVPGRGTPYLSIPLVNVGAGRMGP